MKRIIGIILAVTMLATLMTGCGKKETGTAKNEISEVKVTLPASTGTRAVAEGEAVIATQAYILARSYFEKLETYDTGSFDAEEYRQLLAQASEAFRAAEALCTSFESHAGALADIEENGNAKQEKSSIEILSVPDSAGNLPFAVTSYAANEKSPAEKYAEELTKTFDNAKNGAKLKTVAEKYNVDVKKAKVMLEQAQAILEGAAYEDQAEFENKCYQTAVETKAAASAIGFGVAVAATGGIAAGGAVTAAGIVEAGGIVCSGLNAVIDMGTAVTIHVTGGEGNDLTEDFSKASEALAPVSAFFAIGGGIQNIKDFRNPEKAAEAVNNAAQAFLTGVGFIRDYVQDGTVLGVSANMINGYREIIVRSAETAEPEAAKEVLIRSGITEEALEIVKDPGNLPQEGKLGTQADFYIEGLKAFADPDAPIDFKAVMEYVNTLFDEYAEEECADIGEETAPATDPASETVTESATEPATEPVTEPVTDGPDDTESEPEDEGKLPIGDVAGTYNFVSENGEWLQTVTVSDATHLKFTDDTGASMVARYDESTGIALYSEGDETYTASVRVTFKRAGSGIKAVMVMTLNDESVTSTAVKK